MSTMAGDPRVIAQRTSPAALGKLVLRRARQGELGSIPVVVGVVVIWLIFSQLNEHFISFTNITNLFDQISSQGGVISIGVVLVLLLGEIDLSAAYTAGFTSAVLVVLIENHGVSGPIGCLAAIVTGAVIGTVIGALRANIGIPSFIVTLAFNIGLQGALLYTLGNTGTVNINNSFLLDLDNRLLPVWLGWTIAVVITATVVLAGLYSRMRRAASGLTNAPLIFSILRWTAVGVGAFALAYVTSQDRRVNKSPVLNIPPIEGMPMGIAIFLGFVIAFHLLMSKTRFGRDVYAVGGNDEASRRAGIDVNRIRISVFALSSSLAAVGGILLASHARAVNQSTGGSDLLLNSIAAAVIGGTSLFGGRGAVWTAVLGWLVIGSISNGMDLLSLATSVKFMITGGVLLAAVVVDAVSRRGRAASGRA